MSKPIQTPFGAVSGTDLGGVTRYLGVPFAKPPVGELRFRDPQLPQPWDGVLEATGYRKDPIQSNLVLDVSHYSEDCLYLNIWVPETAEEKTPVMVWIPGGAFSNGGSGAVSPEGPSQYDCEIIARDTGCIIVSMSYRLNVFGFLNFSAYSSRFDDNLGMKDIILALRWVNMSIGAFGGDKDNVTIFGESAGGEAITALLLIDEAKPYYHKAIVESNCFGSFYTVEEERLITDKFLEFAGLESVGPEGLLNMSYEDILAAKAKLELYSWQDFFGRCTFCPVVDGVFLKDFPTISRFEGLDKPVLIGSNRSEAHFQVLLYQWKDEEYDACAAAALRRLTPEDRKPLLAPYENMRNRFGLGELLTDVMYTFPKVRFAEHACTQVPVYLYRYDYVTPVLRKMGLGACHVTELLPLFEIKEPPYGAFAEGDGEMMHAIGTRMRRYWGAFARTGRPDVPGQTKWEPYDLERRSTLIIDREDTLASDPERAVRERFAHVERVLI